jgi:hypothetical protein
MKKTVERLKNEYAVRVGIRRSREFDEIAQVAITGHAIKESAIKELVDACGVDEFGINRENDGTYDVWGVGTTRAGDWRIMVSVIPPMTQAEVDEGIALAEKEMT